ncbi:MAG: histidinol dehydrogenase, partial [Crenarchaeota archaeon]|nr:histidinol dehydrogenase [Thermoproteota archaeon]
MIKILQVGNVDSFVKSKRQKTSQKDRKIVQSILDDVRKNGDSAVKKYEQKFNGKKTTQLRVSKQDSINAKITDAEFTALQLSAIRLAKSQRILNKSLIQAVKKIPNVSFVPIPSVGCYIPGGQARYPSSAIMSII